MSFNVRSYLMIVILVYSFVTLSLSGCGGSSGGGSPLNDDETPNEAVPVEKTFRFIANGLLGTLILNETENSTPFTLTASDSVKSHTYGGGTSYSFTITDMPPHQICTITNSTGTTDPVETVITINCTTKEKEDGVLQGKRIALSPGHGYTYDTSDFQWEYQRNIACDLREDVFNQDMVIDHLIPSFGRSGAQVINTRERVKNGGIAYFDNSSEAYSDTESWEDVANGYLGNLRKITAGSTVETASWDIEVDTSSRYSLYIHYIQEENNSSQVQYELNHAGGRTAFTIDQSRWSYIPSGEATDTGIWYPAGDFYFNGGETYSLTLSTSGTESGKTIIADAVRLGGGMGTVDYGDEISGVATWHEDSLTFLKSLGVPDWLLTHDVTCRPSYALYLGADAYISVHANANSITSSGSMAIVWGTEPIGSAAPDPTVLPPGTMDLAASINTRLVERIRSDWDSEWNDHGILSAYFGELRMIQNAWVADSTVAVPAVMIETGFIDNCENDALFLKDTEFRNDLSYSILKGVIDYFANLEGTTANYPPRNVINLAATVSGSTINLSWTSQGDSEAPSESEPDYYFIYTSADGVAFISPPTSTLNTAYSFNANGTDHRYFKVTAYNSMGESADSVVIHAE